MKPHWFRKIAATAASVVGMAAITFSALPTQAAPFSPNRNEFADREFSSVWARTDSERVRGGRSWYWGPNTWFDYAEFYRESPNGLRTVQYLDKARMEINNPDDRSFQGGVTNGLLVVEMISGRLQTGNQPWDRKLGEAADVPVAGNPLRDNPNAPTYASFAGVTTTDNNNRASNRLGQRISQFIDKGGNISERSDLASAETEIVQFNSVTGHNISKVFWDFMNLRGRVLVNDNVRDDVVVDWLFTMGLPISDPHWVRAKVGDTERDVLVQMFERRVLTYTPSNPDGFKVEMGNVGQHYFQWRYPHLGTPWAAPVPTPRPVFGRGDSEGGVWQIHYQNDNGLLVQVTEGASESVPYSVRRSFEPAQTRILFDSRRGNGEHRQIYELDIPSLYNASGRPRVNRLYYSDGTLSPNNEWNRQWTGNPANDYNPSVSPDGTKIVFASDREGAPQLYLMDYNGSWPVRLTSDTESGCTNQVPVWSPEGRALYWERQCPDGRFTIMRGELRYQNDNQYSVSAELFNVRALTNGESDDRFPRVSPDGRTLAFTSYRDGNAEIYAMVVDGRNVRRLTNDGGEDEAPVWNADGTRILFQSNRSGKYKLYTMAPSGENVSELTGSEGHERWATWAQ
jgi:WD40 repeat protein